MESFVVPTLFTPLLCACVLAVCMVQVGASSSSSSTQRMKDDDDDDDDDVM